MLGALWRSPPTPVTKNFWLTTMMSPATKSW